MKRLFTILGCAVLVCSATTSCTQDVTEEAGAGAAAKKTISVTMEAPVLDEGSRVSLDSDNFLVWETGDKIALYDGEVQEEATVSDFYVGSRVSETAEFESAGNVFGDIFGVYPASAVKDAWGNKLTPGNAYFNYKQTASDEKKYLSTLAEAAKHCVLVGRVDDNGELALYNATSIVEVELTGSDKLYSVSLMSRTQSLSGTFTYSIDDERPVLVPVNKASGASEGAVVADVAGAITLSSTPVKFYFVVPAGTYPAGDLYLEIVTENYSVNKVSTAEHTFNRNHVRPFATINVTKPTVGATDLSANGNANCYLVAPVAGTYHFSVDDINGDKPVQMESKAAKMESGKYVYGAKIAWQTSDNLIADVFADCENGTISFTIPEGGKQGSALVVATSSGANGILWSWLVWVSDAADQQVGNVTMLDRNLGATWTPKSVADVQNMTNETAAQTVGYYYQLGRPVPMPMPHLLADYNTEWGVERPWDSNTQQWLVNRFCRWTQGFYPKNNTASVDDSCWWPMAFLKVTEAGEFQDSWAKDVVAKGEGATWSTDAKTKYDPCPAGYRVPSGLEAQNLRYSADGTTVTYLRPKNDEEGGTTSWYGGYVDGVKDGSFLWLPRSGYRHSGNNTEANKGKYWQWTTSLYFAGGYIDTESSNTKTLGQSFMWALSKQEDTYMNGWETIAHNQTTEKNPYPLSTKDDGTTSNIYQTFLYGGTGNSGTPWNMGDKNTSSGETVMSAASALVVRCVKIDASAASLSASSMSAATDANTWR